MGATRKVKALTLGTDKHGGVHEERNVCPVVRMGYLFILFIYLMMKGGSQFNSATILSDFWTRVRQRPREQGV